MDPAALISGVGKLIASAMPQLSEKDRLDVARVLMSEDPDLVRRALIDNSQLDAVLNKVQQIVNAAGAGARTGVSQQTGGLLAEGNY
jgi:hypothetical protein